MLLPETSLDTTSILIKYRYVNYIVNKKINVDKSDKNGIIGVYTPGYIHSHSSLYHRDTHRDTQRDANRLYK